MAAPSPRGGGEAFEGGCSGQSVRITVGNCHGGYRAERAESLTSHSVYNCSSMQGPRQRSVGRSVGR
jgi:hypothetical protein